jgi:hypothetical protein
MAMRPLTASTTTPSVTAPTLKTAESTARSRTLSVTARDAILNPGEDTRNWYSPAASPARVNCPAAFVVAVRVAPVAPSRAAIVAPCTAAPATSFTEPTISARPLNGPRSCSICRSTLISSEIGGPAILRVRTSSMADRSSLVSKRLSGPALRTL